MQFHAVASFFGFCDAGIIPLCAVLIRKSFP
jgi:hypothetical protein